MNQTETGLNPMQMEAVEHTDEQSERYLRTEPDRGGRSHICGAENIPPKIEKNMVH